jgi:hypothetical protein
MTKFQFITSLHPPAETPLRVPASSANRLKKENSQVVSATTQFKLLAPAGKCV